MINIQEKHAAKFVALFRVVEILKRKLQEANPYKWNLYCGNCCRQTAFISSEWLNENMKSYKWRIYEASFILNETGQVFEHAWVYGSPIGKGEGIFVDLAFNPDKLKNFLFEGENNFPDDEIAEVEGTRKQVGVDFFRREREYFTGIEGRVIYSQIKKEIEHVNK